MSKLRVQSFAVSIDGYGAGPNQSLEHPLGTTGPELMEWFFHTRLWRKMHGHDDGEAGVDNGLAEQGFGGIGAWLLGRNMFGPIRGEWVGSDWTVLSGRAQSMANGTTSTASVRDASSPDFTKKAKANWS
jgi:dihydrofolate reductase